MRTGTTTWGGIMVAGALAIDFASQGYAVREYVDNGDGSLTIVLGRHRIGLEAADVREALRVVHNPVALARTRLASGTTALERSRVARGRLERALDEAFGPSPSEQSLRGLLVLAYFERPKPLEQLADDLHYSRRSFFRRLSTAVERLAEAIELH